ncbi:hypothetical protein [Faecalicatena contorta]|uniref:Uncharacterized protein n=1 Tax=Faecalicatena contorta TaxID=39482 RepID=A0A316A2A8_9FIRM|nr:hypothetical protein [Faecalicatena contorta]PWJ51110.1 hypothetical protein A8805_103411 [Faecalicatena contorta]SUQ13678.1 hypothetical protein SAMN05216529_103411 [Faecalicatena contorta]
MIKNDVKIKKELSLSDKISAIEYISSSYFTEDENGKIQYTPYYAGIAQVNAIMKYFTDGVEFEDSEDIYEMVINDDSLRTFVDSFFVSGQNTAAPSNGQEILYEVMSTVADIVEYKKKENLAKLQSENSNILAYKQLKLMEKEEEKLQLEMDTTKKLDEWLNVQKELNSVITPEMQQCFMENFDVNDIMDTVINKYGESEIQKKNEELIEANRKIREQDNKIIELQTAFARKEQKEDAD